MSGAHPVPRWSCERKHEERTRSLEGSAAEGKREEMTTSWEKATVFDVTPEKLLEVMTHPDFQVAQRLNDSAVKDARFVEVSRTEDRLVYEVQATEYERGLTGLNKNKTVESVSRFEWDLKRKTCQWFYKSPMTDKASISGFNRIEASGDKAKMVGGFSVGVKIPLVGGKIEKAISSGMTSGRDKYDDTLRDYCRKLA